ncbi:hypothetical protein V493_00902 [Pseudogymnoascus sp. VKM F-4281 (FW-2241)]|nr:hypothetical protein V493_00902 [Pseudogymnoascus sp. VKM F-4281 (FW-2241)]
MPTPPPLITRKYNPNRPYDSEERITQGTPPSIPAAWAQDPNPSVESAPLFHSPGQMCHVGSDGVAGGPGPCVHVRDSVAPGLWMGDGDVDCVTPAD